MLALGRLFNVVAAASGVHIPLKNAAAVTFVTYLDAGSQTATIKKSVGGDNETALDVNVRPFKGPGVGGTWTAMAEQDDTLDLGVDGDDATNDMMVFTVHANQLNGNPADANHGDYDCVEVTVDSGICVAIVHDLLVQRGPANLARSVV